MKYADTTPIATRLIPNSARCDIRHMQPPFIQQQSVVLTGEIFGSDDSRLLRVTSRGGPLGFC